MVAGITVEMLPVVMSVVWADVAEVGGTNGLVLRVLLVASEPFVHIFFSIFRRPWVKIQESLRALLAVEEPKRWHVAAITL